ncbi:MAG: hypothetical protein P1V20_28210, partial [Verrucomicrobiales bacterium]|nr:hypothetical protein [Verrucomicrobiales bacterium]
GDEVAKISGVSDGEESETEIGIISPGSEVANYAFDVTPRHLITGLITERGVCPADADGVFMLFPEKRKR